MHVEAQDTDARVRSSGRLDGAVLALLLLAVALRAFRLGDQIVFGDEVITLRAAVEHSPTWLLTNYGIHDFSGLFAVYYQWVASLAELNEWTMRLPVLLAGSLTPVLIWRALRDKLDRTALLLCLALLALSPILIHHSRFARPYTLILDLEILAAMSLWTLLHTRSKGALLAHSICAAIAVAMSLSAAVFLASLWLSAGFFAVLSNMVEERPERLARILKGIVGSAILTLLLYIPSFASLEMLLFGRSGKGAVSLASLFDSFQLVVGTPNVVWNLLLAIFMAVGLLTLFRSSKAVGASTLVLLVVPTLVVATLNPHRAQLPHVFVRYWLGSVPVAIILIAVGAGNLIDAATSRLTSSRHARNTLGAVAGIALVLGIASAGPLPDTHLRFNNLALHPRHIRYLSFPGAIDRVPSIYRQIASDPRPGIVIEAPWCGGSGMGAALEIYQRVHAREMIVLPNDELYASPGFRFKTMRTLSALDELAPGTANWMMIHRDIDSEMNQLEIEGHAGRKCDASRFIGKLEARYGEPAYRDEWIAAFLIAG